ncbi:SlyX family protein [Agaribacter flavus]|uniref:Protein SlyX homolog n=1 Tax=Agaribacter flavus TaxID=1902781 RepID=A0ABV7FTA2_9ALTE
MNQILKQEVLIERLDYLEVKVAYQEDTIEKLNQTLVEQQQMIEKMERKMTIVSDKLKSIQISEMPSADQVEIPPHY